MSTNLTSNPPYNDPSKEDWKCYDMYAKVDPFPEIASALLNSADLRLYINIVKIIHPFDEDNLSGVTIKLSIGKIGVYWNEKGEKIEKDIKSDGSFCLKSNTIAYVQVYEYLRLPAYIISRFNLRVELAYKGILLGTGPIVDPGFCGYLNIPLHNLTNNDYYFNYNDSFIEMEFTKISPHNDWLKDSVKLQKQQGKYKYWKNSSSTSQRDINYYLYKANSGRSISSSLPALNEKVKESIDEMKKETEKGRDFVTKVNVGILFSAASFISLYFALFNFISTKMDSYNDKLDDLTEENRQLNDTIDVLNTKLRNIDIILMRGRDKHNQTATPSPSNNKSP